MYEAEPYLYEFQYISCCSLSKLAPISEQAPLNFNTSHVVVYRFSLVFPLLLPPHFNTSHVVVYLF